VAGKRPKDEVLSEIELKLKLETVQTTLANKLRVASHCGLRLGGASTGLWLGPGASNRAMGFGQVAVAGGLIQRRQLSSSAIAVSPGS
jgi:hypothetical protein